MLLAVAVSGVVFAFVVFAFVVVVVVVFLVHVAGTMATVFTSGTLLQQAEPPFSATPQLLLRVSHLAFLSSVLPLWLAHLKVPVTPSFLAV